MSRKIKFVHIQEFIITEIVAAFFYFGPFTSRLLDITQTAASIGRLIQARKDELQLQILGLELDAVLKPYAMRGTFAIWRIDNSFLR
jgi:hypothetical protein